MKDTDDIVYDEEKIDVWKKERKHKNIFLNVIPIILFGSASILLSYAILMGGYESGSLGMFLIALLMCIYLIIVSYRNYRKYSFLKVYKDRILLPRRQGIFLRKDTCYIKYIKKAYLNVNRPQKYVALTTTEDDPTWKGEPVQIWKEDIYSIDDFISSLEKLGVVIERKIDYEVMYTPGLSTSLRGREVRE